MKDNPGALGSGSTIHSTDFYGNTETWVVETFRTEDGREVGFLQRNGPEGGTRWVLPAEVMAALSRHRDQLVSRSRKRAARRGLETRKLRGQVIGNPAALAAGRARQAGKRAPGSSRGGR